MKKNKKILFPTDFSEPSANAFRYALCLADHLEAAIDVIHVGFPVVETVTYTGYSNSSTLTMRESLKARIKTFVEEGITQVLEQLNNAPVVDSDVFLGTPVSAITQIAKKKEVDFILMGSHGENKSLIEKLMGSVAAGVVETATCPVFVIPEEVTFKSDITIAYATNLSDSDPFEIWKAVQLLSPLKPSVRVVHIRLPNEKVDTVETKIDQMDIFFKEHHPEMQITFHSIPGRSLQKEIDTFTEVYKLDMLVMYQPHHSFWNRLFFRSNTKEMAVHTKLPLLVQKEA